MANRGIPCGHDSFDATSDAVLGQIGIAVNAHHRSAEAYYWVLPGQRRLGVAPAALGLVADWAFDNEVERLYLLVHVDNKDSNGRTGWGSPARASCAPTSPSTVSDRIWCPGRGTLGGTGPQDAGVQRSGGAS